MRPLAISLTNAALGILALVFAANAVLLILVINSREEAVTDTIPWLRFSEWRRTFLMSIVAIVLLLLAFQAFGVRVTPGFAGWLLAALLVVVISLFAAEVVARAATYVRERRARTHGHGASSDDVA